MNEYTFGENPTVKNLLYKSAELYGDNPAFYLRDMGEALYSKSYKELLADVKALSSQLLRRFGQGSKVAIIMKNRYEWCLTYLACAFCGIVAVPLDKDMPEEEISNIFNFAEVDAAVCDKDTFDKVKDAGDTAEKKPKIITCDDENGGTVLSKLMERGQNDLSKKAEKVKINPDSMAFLLFTSGTTGMVKGVMLSNRNLCSDIQSVSYHVKPRREDIALSVLPLHHAYESAALLMMLFSGGAVAFSRGLRRLPADFADVRPTVLVAVPLLVEKLHSRFMSKIEERGKKAGAKLITRFSPLIPKEKRLKLFHDIHEFFGGRLRLIVVGAAAMKKEIAEDFSAFGIPLVIGYGLTECSPIVISNTAESPTTDSIGKPLPGVSVKINNPDENGAGELLIKGDMVMLGYYKNKALTDSTLIDGYLRTGDIGYRDKQGNYHISGRNKNVIITSNGKNVYPEEIEYYLTSRTVVAECVVSEVSRGILQAEIFPDEAGLMKKLGKREISKSEASDLVKQAVRFTNSKLPSYKRIKKVVLRKEEFPKTSTHKIIR